MRFYLIKYTYYIFITIIIYFLFTEGPFCFCFNANNHTFSCLRTINATHNYLYCEFVTGLVTFYNMKIDPFQQWNRVHTLEPKERQWLRDSLSEMLRCKGSAQCAISPVKRRKKLDGFNALSVFGMYLHIINFNKLIFYQIT